MPQFPCTVINAGRSKANNTLPKKKRNEMEHPHYCRSIKAS